MLDSQQPKIDISQLPANAIDLCGQLVALSQDYANRCLIILDPFLSIINNPIIDYFDKLGRIQQIPIMHAAILAAKRPLLLELNLAIQYEIDVLSYIVSKALMQSTPSYQRSGNGQHYSAWLFTKLSTSKIASGLAKLAIQKGTNDKTYFLRFYDPTVLSQLRFLLTQPQQQRLFGQIDHWVILNHDSTFNIHSPKIPSMPVLSGQLALTNQQLQQLRYIGINNQIIHSQKIIHPTQTIDELKSLQKIMPCLQRLMDKKIDDESLMIEWAKLALKLGDNFDMHPKIQSTIQKLSNSQQYYTLIDKLQILTNKDWQAL
ncbi:hypothetical protein GCM10023211_16980 [Orbus sasakiae]|uniref:DUF4123 domain-containing protein n=1 Tax=Orbus sasakiae TaxID=1078475 RepID=A0ABP9N7Q5_9GAMM